MQRQEQIALEITDVTELLRPELPDSLHITRHRSVDISRHPIAAEKDPRAVRKASQNNQPDQLLTKTLATLMKALFPHAWVEDALYLDIADQALRSTEIAHTVRHAAERAETFLGESLLSSPAPALVDALRRMEGEPAFRALLGAAIGRFYDDPRIWSGCGYEGVHGCRGGAQRDGIADAAWLPDVEDGQ